MLDYTVGQINHNYYTLSLQSDRGNVDRPWTILHSGIFNWSLFDNERIVQGRIQGIPTLYTRGRIAWHSISTCLCYILLCKIYPKEMGNWIIKVVIHCILSFTDLCLDYHLSSNGYLRYLLRGTFLRTSRFSVLKVSWPLQRSRS